MSYKVYDEELGQFAFGGELFKSKDEARDQILSFFEGDDDEETGICAKEDLERGNGAFQLVIVPSNYQYGEEIVS